VIDLRPFYRAEATQAMQRAASRLRGGKGVGGRRLARKDRSDGRRLGGRIPRDLLRGVVTVSQDGFRVDYARMRHVVFFDEGVARHSQPARPIVGLAPRERTEILARARARVVSQLNMGVR